MCCSLLTVFAIFFAGPLLNLLVLAFSEKWNYPDVLPATWGVQMVELRISQGRYRLLDFVVVLDRGDCNGVIDPHLHPDRICVRQNPVSAEANVLVLVPADAWM
ncbi:hypothetical protein M3G15_17120 [Paenibacillus sp. p3-SID1389]|nr:hypothetical protein [Paenibacillus sp. p3-SID1389]MCT2196851.1 hypothetical protein [Paenibacillus sp. p3-SID1389]